MTREICSECKWPVSLYVCEPVDQNPKETEMPKKTQTDVGNQWAAFEERWSEEIQGLKKVVEFRNQLNVLLNNAVKYGFKRATDNALKIVKATK